MELHYRTEDAPSQATLPYGALLMIGTDLHLPYDVADRPQLATFDGEFWTFTRDSANPTIRAQSLVTDAWLLQRQLAIADEYGLEVWAQDANDQFTIKLAVTDKLLLNASKAGGVELYTEGAQQRVAHWRATASNWRTYAPDRELGERLLIQPARVFAPSGPRHRLSPLAARA
jgi:hypothetical protein